MPYETLFWLDSLICRVVNPDRARAKMDDGASACRFEVLDFLKGPPQGPFDFVFDRGCFHVFDAPEVRARCAGGRRRRIAGIPSTPRAEYPVHLSYRLDAVRASVNAPYQAPRHAKRFSVSRWVPDTRWRSLLATR